jgi:ABC-type sugar transport system ATPase subunit
MEVTVEGLRFARDGRTVLDIPALGFPDGSTTAVFGPNGSGKTTLLRLVAGLEHPTAGTVRIGGEIVQRTPASRRAVAFAFQQAVFVGGSVRANLDLALRLRGVDPPAREWRIEEVSRECGIGGILDRPARQLSGGEAQRVNLARALALRAPVTLLDEPLAGIDRLSRRQLLDEIPRFLTTFAATTLLVTHDREEAFRLADRLVILVAGEVRAAGPKAEVYGRPPDRDVAALLGYTVVDSHGHAVAVPAGGWRPGSGPLTLELVVERVVDMGDHRHVLGSVGGARVDVRLHPGDPEPAPGERVPVTARQAVPLD